MRHALVLLLLVAAAVHPFAHLSEDSVACPCAHGAVAELARPLAVPAETTAPRAVDGDASFVHASIVGEVPARAPPVVA